MVEEDGRTEGHGRSPITVPVKRIVKSRLLRWRRLLLLLWGPGHTVVPHLGTLISPS